MALTSQEVALKSHSYAMMELSISTKILLCLLAVLYVAHSFPLGSVRFSSVIPLKTTEWGNHDLDNEAPTRLLPTTFPKFNATEYAIYRESIDASKLEPDDPYFMDMPWPKVLGPEANAFARHLQWRRNQSQGDCK